MTILELAERCEQATGEDAYLDLDIHKALNLDMAEYFTLSDAPNYCGSIDAAMTLVPEGAYGGIVFGVDDDGKARAGAFVGSDPALQADEREAATPALALCAAALRSRAAHPKDVE